MLLTSIPGEAAEFWARWPAIRDRLDVQLARRGLCAHDRQDIEQDVALLALDAWTAGRIRSSLDGWCSVVATNVANREWHRAGRTVELTGAELVGMDTLSVEETVQSRLEVDGFRQAWALLSQRDRDLLASPSPGSTSSDERNRHYVALHRARARARALASTMTLGFAGWLLHRSRHAAPAVAAAGGVGVALISAVLLMSVPHDAGATLVPPEPGGIGAPTLVRPAPGVPTRTAPADGAADPRGRLRDLAGGMHAPVKRRLDLDTAAGRQAYVVLENGDPAGEPLACATLPPVTARGCIDYPDL